MSPGVGKSSGVRVETTFGVLLVFSDSKLLRGRSYPRREALQAARRLQSNSSVDE